MLRNGKGAVTVSSGSFSTHKGQIHSMGGRRQKPSPNRLENIMLVIYLVWEYNQYGGAIGTGTVANNVSLLARYVSL